MRCGGFWGKWDMDDDAQWREYMMLLSRVEDEIKETNNVR